MIRTSIKDICQLTPTVKWDNYPSNEFEYIDISSVDRDTKEITSTTLVPKDDAPSRAKQPVFLGDVLVSTVRPNLNAVALVESDVTGLIASTGFCVLRPKEDILNSKYLFYFSRTSEFIGNLVQRATGANYPAVSSTIIKSLKIPLPPLETQKRTVDILDRAQSLIDKRKEQIALMDQLIQSLFYDMFGDPVTNPMGWIQSAIGETCYFVKDGPHKSLDYKDKGIPFVSVKDIINGYWDFSNVRHISQEVFQEHKNRCLPEFGDVLYTKGGTTGFAKLVDIEIPFLNWVHIAVLKFDKTKINGKFYESMLNSSYCYQQSQRYTRGIANRDLVLGEMKKIKHFCPPINLQNIFAERTQKIETQKKAMVESLRELEDNFNSIMQRAFKGEI